MDNIITSQNKFFIPNNRSIPIQIEIKGENILPDKQEMIQPVRIKIGPVVSHGQSSVGEQPLHVRGSRRRSQEPVYTYIELNHFLKLLTSGQVPGEPS